MSDLTLYGLLFGLIDLFVSIIRWVWYRKRDSNKAKFAKDSIFFDIVLLFGIFIGLSSF